jgi:prepilin-type processing-associated H-X9-DG protein
MWTEALKNISENSSGNILFFDGSVDGMSKNLRDLMALNAKSLFDTPKNS